MRESWKSRCAHTAAFRCQNYVAFYGQSSFNQETVEILAGNPCGCSTSAGPRCTRFRVLILGWDGSSFALLCLGGEPKVFRRQIVLKHDLTHLGDCCLNLCSTRGLQLFFQLSLLREQACLVGIRNVSVRRRRPCWQSQAPGQLRGATSL